MLIILLINSLFIFKILKESVLTMSVKIQKPKNNIQYITNNVEDNIGETDFLFVSNHHILTATLDNAEQYKILHDLFLVDKKNLNNKFPSTITKLLDDYLRKPDNAWEFILTWFNLA